MFYKIEEIDAFLDARTRGGIKPGLERVNSLLEAIDHPEKKFKSVHIAGTNGKGSTLTYISTCLVLSEYRVGTFTSPSITKRNDMIQINHQAISDQSFIELFNQLLPEIQTLEIQDNPPSSFEIIVAIAYGYFAGNVDVAIIETGMGGLEDATNSIKPILSIITTIGIDHRTFLGETYQEIAQHKAGIIKSNVPVILGEMPSEAERVIQRIAKERHASFLQIGKGFNYLNVQLDNNKRETFTFQLKDESYPITLMMRGRHQIHNATLAVMALLQLRDRGFVKAINAVETGMLQATLFGRFEQISNHPIVIVDGAHNVEGVTAFLDTVKRYFPTEKKQLLFAAFADKPIKEMIAQLDGNFDLITFTSFDHQRAAKASVLYEYSENRVKGQEPDLQKALEQILNKDNKKITFITGSLDFIGKVRDFFE
ncbi:bifunctional folylpolyglutamate synthase/dihydrofolate synthase [Paraliobacillus sediminis]|uniref:bifunctional folylpolyglutamate synthase/dihydrofolate synthase n=1 Tax=Paraliobacillus sediminis TaxID=1885916 RepID=UPI000E3DF7D3|nr:folylpolyglutamate synthase/dihydrofolate synthase family protein [Paraliobacillus sediminis]